MSDEDDSEEMFEELEEDGIINVCNNHLYFYQAINRQGAVAFCRVLDELYNNLLHAMIQTGLTSPVIEIHLNSQGGELLAAISMAHKIEQLKVGMKPFMVPAHVITHIEGEASSAASLISISGNHRTISEHSVILIHDCYGQAIGNQTDIKKFVKNITTQSDEMKKIYAKYTKLSGEELDRYMEEDVYINATDAIKLGLVDEIVV
jgi:ATP-dependent protease ClpP protease subunit